MYDLCFNPKNSCGDCLNKVVDAWLKLILVLELKSSICGTVAMS